MFSGYDTIVHTQRGKRLLVKLDRNHVMYKVYEDNCFLLIVLGR